MQADTSQSAAFHSSASDTALIICRLLRLPACRVILEQHDGISAELICAFNHTAESVIRSKHPDYLRPLDEGTFAARRQSNDEKIDLVIIIDSGVCNREAELEECLQLACKHIREISKIVPRDYMSTGSLLVALLDITSPAHLVGDACRQATNGAFSETIKYMAREHAPNARVNGLMTITIAESLAGPDAGRNKPSSHHPGSRPVDNLIKTLKFLINEAPHVTGQVLVISPEH